LPRYQTLACLAYPVPFQGRRMPAKKFVSHPESGHRLVHFPGMIFLVFGFRVRSVRIHGVSFVPFVPSCERKIRANS
jgi:hypothetical protein